MGDDWNKYVSWYKTLYSNDLQHCKSLSEVVHRRCIDAYLCALQIRTQEEYDKCAGRPANFSSANMNQDLFTKNVSMQPSISDASDFEAGRLAHWDFLTSSV